MPDEPLIVLVAGEASGDQLGGPLIESLRRRCPGARFAGIGGPRMAAAGFEAWWGIEELSVMGLAEVVRHLPRLLALRRQLAERIVAAGPTVLVGIDAPDFNLGLERRVRDAGVPTIHYVSPTVWAWRQGRVKRIGRSASLVLCLFPFEPDLYAGHGVDARYTGHPLADAIADDIQAAPARQALGMAPDGPVVALLPGSRGAEVGRLAGPMLDAAQTLAGQRPGIRFVAPMASPRVRSLFETALAQRGELDITLLDGGAQQAMAAADVVVCASGTATLEGLLVNRPLVVVYRVSATTAVIARSLRLIKSEFVSLPNALAGEALVPELLQEAVTGPAIADAVGQWLDDPDRRLRLAERFRAIHAELRRGAADSAAEAILAFIDAHKGHAATV